MCIVNRFSKVLLRAIALGNGTQLQLQASMAEVESGFQNGKANFDCLGTSRPLATPSMAQTFASALPQAELSQAGGRRSLSSEHWHEPVMEDLYPFSAAKLFN